MHLALISDGTVTQQRSIEGDEDFELKGAKGFLPNGLKWVDYSYESEPEPFQLDKVPLSARGALSVDRLNRKPARRSKVVFSEHSSRRRGPTRTGQMYRFAVAEPGHDILQAVLPDGKFTDYLFNRDHHEGVPKRVFVIDELGFEPDDWRYLAAQFYDGLLLSEPRDLIIKRWKDSYGARFNVFVEITLAPASAALCGQAGCLSRKSCQVLLRLFLVVTKMDLLDPRFRRFWRLRWRTTLGGQSFSIWPMSMGARPTRRLCRRRCFWKSMASSKTVKAVRPRY